MRTIFCNIAYMKLYCGANENDLPKNGGTYIKENQDGGECFNFLDNDGSCYGFYMHNGDNMHIERIEGVTARDESVENVTVIWTARSPEHGSNVIVGWYKNAIVYRKQQYHAGFDLGISSYYNILAKAEDCFLLPEDQRTFDIPRASRKGTGNGMGQSAVWYAESENAQKVFIPKVMKYIDEYDKKNGEYINTVITDEMLEERSDDNISYSNYLKRAKDKNICALDAIKYINSALDITKDDNSLKIKAEILVELHRYRDAIPYAEQSYEKDKTNGGTLTMIMDLYMITDQHEKAVITGKLVEKHADFSALDDNAKMYVYYSIANQYVFLRKKTYANEYLVKCKSLSCSNDYTDDIDIIQDDIDNI